MAENGGFIPLEAQRTKFKFKEGVHQLGALGLEILHVMTS